MFKKLKFKKGNPVGAVLLLITAITLSGCATKAPLKAPSASSAPLYALDTVAIETASNIRELSEIQTAALASESSEQEWRSFMFNLQTVPVALSKKETFNFVGTAEDGVKGIADLAGYSFHVVGSPPAEPLMVSIQSKNQMLIDSLRDINAQINHKANVMISPKSKLVTLTFRQIG
ncbi:DotD/TraH family lipoprotein [Fangia hongkongensis]|uniref:DotD/TraH family lipoprotein n=1 Tax=Fangia hongkongensis TaxID=270495 RepID=UPI000377A135|nr:DotD/TraH family lipoprotein [Fangia hongkongensis]MBK2125656.1 DotD/TraH family lipoprotein [Fangia hongkongensis]